MTTCNTHSRSGEVRLCGFQVTRTDRQRNKLTDILITILRTPPGGDLMMAMLALMAVQVLVVAAQSCDIVAQQHAFNRLASVPPLSLHPHLRAPRHAALRRRVSTRIIQPVPCLGS